MSDPVLFPLMLIRSAGLPLSGLDLGETTFDVPLSLVKAAENALDLSRSVLNVFELERESDPNTPLDKAIMNMRRRLRKMQSGGLTLPVPVPLVIEQERPDLNAVLQQWNSAVDLRKNALESLQVHYDDALKAAYSHLQTLANNETLCRALLFASHDLLRRLPAFAQKPVAEFHKKDRQTALSLWQYATRAATKTSPLSRFTSVSILRWENPAPEFFAGPKAIATPNVALLPAIYEVLLREPVFYKSLKVKLNPCITFQSTQPIPPNSPPPYGGDGGSLEWLYFDGEQESFQQLPPNEATLFLVKTLLENKRQLTFSDLLERFGESVEAAPAALENYLLELIDLGLLEWVLPELGLQVGWCGGLYQYLGFLPTEPVIVEAAALMQWLRTAARTMPFQSLETAMETQRDALAQTQQFLERFGGIMPPIPPEQIFYEDVEEAVQADVPAEALQALALELAEAWRQKSQHRLPDFKSALAGFAKKGQSVDFLGFCKSFLIHKSNSETHVVASGTPFRGKIGALLQIFRENGQWRAVVNGLFPGGGKLFARWLHLFPADVREQLQAWLNAGENAPLSFPWQGWNNANFQAPGKDVFLDVPDGRLTGNTPVLLGNLRVEWRLDGLQLVDSQSAAPVLMTDLGLEAPESRPPAMQVLWHLGVPYVSMEALLPDKIDPGQEIKFGHFRSRIEQGSLVLARAMWRMDSSTVEQLLTFSDLEFFVEIRVVLDQMQVPRRFFARTKSGKPQFFDADNPLSVLQLEKMLRQGNGPLSITEMLPMGEQCIVDRDGVRAAEFVVELDLG